MDFTMFPCRVFAPTGLALLAILLGGCGGDRGPQRVVVSGTVNYNGKPIPVGAIHFIPTANNPAPTSGAQIIDGKYEANSHGGVPVGTHRIQIEAYTSQSGAKTAGSAGPPGADGLIKQYLPGKYNDNTTLEITIPPGSREITKDFDLTN